MEPQQKLPIPRQPSTNKRKFRHFKSLTTKQMEKRLKDRTRVSLCSAFERWRQLREQRGYKSDEELALFLLDRSDKYIKSTLDKYERSEAEAPVKRRLSPAPLSADVSSIFGLSQRVDQNEEEDGTCSSGAEPKPEHTDVDTWHCIEVEYDDFHSEDEEEGADS